MAVKRDQPEEEPNYEDSDDSVELEEHPTQEEVKNLEQKLATNSKNLDKITEALADSMLVSVIMAAVCPENSEIQEKINSSNEAIVACVKEAAKIGSVLNYIKEELKQYK